jgi:hypothetical protein
MRTKIGAATFLLVSAGAAATVGALGKPGAVINMLGSDTLHLITVNVINNCTLGASSPLSISYGGTGTGNGEGNMARTWAGAVTGLNRQTMSPMSRFLQAGGSNKTCTVRACVSAKRACTVNDDCFYAGDTCVAGRCLSTPLNCTADANCAAVVPGDTCGPAATKAEGIAFALDGLAIAGNSAKSDGCGGISHTTPIAVTDLNGDGLVCPGCDASNNYAPTAWTHPTSGITFDPALDFLRVLFYGVHHDGTRDCGSDVRRTMARNYGNVFQSPGSCTGNTCPVATFNAAGVQTGGLRHLWRRDDGSGTTDVFNALIGGATNQFCNACPTGATCTFPAAQGTDFLDNDAIRVNCDGNGRTGGVQVCGNAATPAKLKNLGLLLTIFIPRNLDVPASDTYAAGICGTAQKLLPATSPTFIGKCPGNNSSFTGKCFASVISPAPTPQGFNANCVQAFAPAGTCPALTPAGTECRGANLWLRKPDGAIQRDFSFPAAGAAGRLYTGAFYRIHATTWQTNGTGGCTAAASSTEQIGCLTGAADPCSLGFCGNNGVDPPGLQIAQRIKGVLPSPTTIADSSYLLRRKIYYNSMIGFENVGDDELALAKCVSDDAFMAPIIPAEGFFQLPEVPAKNGGTHRALCEDFKEENPVGLLPDPYLAGCAVPVGSSSNACDGNPAGIAPEKL